MSIYKYKDFLPELGKKLDWDGASPLADLLADNHLPEKSEEWLRANFAVASENVPLQDKRWTLLTPPKSIPASHRPILDEILRYAWRNSAVEKRLITSLSLDKEAEHLQGQIQLFISFNTRKGLPVLNILDELMQSSATSTKVKQLWPTEILKPRILTDLQVRYFSKATAVYPKLIGGDFSSVHILKHNFSVEQPLHAYWPEVEDIFPGFNEVKKAVALRRTLEACEKVKGGDLEALGEVKFYFKISQGRPFPDYREIDTIFPDFEATKKAEALKLARKAYESLKGGNFSAVYKIKEYLEEAGIDTRDHRNITKIFPEYHRATEMARRGLTTLEPQL